MNTTIPADLATAIAEHYDANPDHLCIDLFYASEGKEQPYRADVVAKFWREKALETAQTPAARMERLLQKFPYLFDEDERGPRGVAPSSKDMKESYDLLNIALTSYGPESRAYKQALDVHARLARLCYRHGVPHRSNTPKWRDDVNAIVQGLAADHETT